MVVNKFSLGIRFRPSISMDQVWWIFKRRTTVWCRPTILRQWLARKPPPCRRPDLKRRRNSSSNSSSSNSSSCSKCSISKCFSSSSMGTFHRLIPLTVATINTQEWSTLRSRCSWEVVAKSCMVLLQASWILELQTTSSRLGNNWAQKSVCIEDVRQPDKMVLVSQLEAVVTKGDKDNSVWEEGLRLKSSLTTSVKPRMIKE